MAWQIISTHTEKEEDPNPVLWANSARACAREGKYDLAMQRIDKAISFSSSGEYYLLKLEFMINFQHYNYAFAYLTGYLEYWAKNFTIQEKQKLFSYLTTLGSWFLENVSKKYEAGNYEECISDIEDELAKHHLLWNNIPELKDRMTSLRSSARIKLLLSQMWITRTKLGRAIIVAVCLALVGICSVLSYNSYNEYNHRQEMQLKADMEARQKAEAAKAQVEKEKKDKEAAKNNLVGYYTAIDKKDFNKAYSYLSSRYKKSKRFEDFKNEYNGIISSNVTVKNVSDKSDDSIDVEFTLNQKNRNEEQTLDSTFEGKWTVVKEKEQWVLDQNNIKLVKNIVVKKDNAVEQTSYGKNVFGKIRGVDVILRSSPSTMGTTVTYLDQGTKVSILKKRVCKDKKAAVLVADNLYLDYQGQSIDLPKGLGLVIKGEKNGNYLCEATIKGKNLVFGTARNTVKSIYGDEWYNVKLNNGQEGWVYADYITPL